MLYNIMRQNKITKERDFLPHNECGWIKSDSKICRKVLTENDAEFILNQLTFVFGNDFYFLKALNSITKIECEICHYVDYTGTNGDRSKF